MNNSIIFLISVFLFSCVSSNKTIDTSSNKRLIESIEKIEEDLSTDKKREFNKALINIAAENKNWFDTISKNNIDDIKEKILDKGAKNALYCELYDDNIKRKLDGKTADELIEESSNINKDRTSNPFYYLDKVIKMSDDYNRSSLSK